MALLADKLRSLPDARLVVIDPISSYLGGADSHRNDRMRELLDPLAAVAAKHRVAMIAVTHPPKGRSQDPRDHFIGSVAFNAAARASFLIERDPLKNYRRLLLQVKNNLCPEAGTLAFSIAQREVAPNVNGLYAIFEPNHAPLSVRDLLVGRSARRLERAEVEGFCAISCKLARPLRSPISSTRRGRRGCSGRASRSASAGHCATPAPPWDRGEALRVRGECELRLGAAGASISPSC